MMELELICDNVLGVICCDEDGDGVYCMAYDLTCVLHNLATAGALCAAFEIGRDGSWIPNVIERAAPTRVAVK